MNKRLLRELYKTKTDALYNLHLTLGHLPFSRIERMIRKGIWNKYVFDGELLKQLVNVRCNICMCAKITDGSHTSHLFRSDKPWRMFCMDVQGPFAQASIHGNYYHCPIIDTCSIYVFNNFLVDKDEVYSVLSDFCEDFIIPLRARDTSVYELFLTTDLGEGHSNKVINLCNKYGIVKQSTAGYTPDHNAFVERWFRTIGEMSRCQLAQFGMEEEYWEDARDHAAFLFNRVPPSHYVPGEPWLAPIQRQFPDRKVTDLSKLQPFGIQCWTHIKKARRPAKSDINPRGEEGVLVGYDDTQGPLLARIYFPSTRVYELHENGYVRYQDIQHMIRETDSPSSVEPPLEKPVDFFRPLVGSRHVDPKNGLTYETVELKITRQRDIVAWRRRVINGVLQDAPQGPFHVRDIYQYTQDTIEKGLLSAGMLKRQSGKKQAPSGISHRVVPIDVHDPDVGDGDVPTGARISPNPIGPLQGLQRKRTLSHTQTGPAMENATTMEVRNAQSHMEQNAQTESPRVNARYNLRSHTNNVASKSDACDSHRRFRAASHLASAVVHGDFFTYLALDEITESVTDTNLILSPKDNQKDDYIPPNRKAMLNCKYKVKWEEAEADELRSFAKCDVMTKYPPPPENVKVLPLKWIYTVKKDLKGIIIRYKARLVAQGFFQVFGVDYTDTYSPVAKFVSIRVMLAISMQLGLIVHTMDVDTAFLNAPLEENIWVKIPDGTQLPTGDNGIYKLIKSLYGLKQASRCWNNLINEYLIESGFQRLEADPCIYVREIQIEINGEIVIKFQIVALYVDDLIIAASNKNLITDLEKVFEARFKMKKLNKIKQILGMGVHHDKDRNTIYITQQQYIEDSVKRFAKYGISEFRTPMDDRQQFSKQQMPKEGSPEALQVATFPYRELIGTLLWI